MSTPKKKVLIVEDDESTRGLYKHFLEADGFQVATASDGWQALAQAGAENPDLILLDLMLPELHGIGVCKALKSNPATREAKILIVSVKGFSADRKQAAEAGADEFLVKPVPRAALLAAVRKWLNMGA